LVFAAPGLIVAVQYKNIAQSFGDVMTRREFVGAASTALVASAASRNQPNVLMIGVDEMNDWVGCLGGYPGVRTPNIDRLARMGTLFQNAHCAAPVCNPPAPLSLRGAELPPPGSTTTNNAGVPRFRGFTMPEYFRKNGYYVANMALPATRNL
jgi:hypothetical protein